MSKISEVADIIVGSLGRTHGQMMLASTQALYPPGHPERCFVEWLNDNQGRLAEAGAELGVLPGPRLYSRLKAAYIERQEASDAIPPVR